MTTGLALVCSGLAACLMLLIGDERLVVISCMCLAVVWLSWLASRPASHREGAAVAVSGEVQGQAHSAKANAPSRSTQVVLPKASGTADHNKSAAHATTASERRGVSSLATIGTSPTPVVKPAGAGGRGRSMAEHFERHLGVAGQLYIARNDHHRPDLYKLGYTTIPIEGRMRFLNEEHDNDTHVGEFRAIDAVPVAGAFEDEQLLFEVLVAYRVAPGREFFLVPLETARLAMRAVSDYSLGNAATISEGLPALSPAPVELLGLRSIRAGAVVPTPQWHGGWVVILRNECHAPDTFRMGCTTQDPHDYLDRINAPQRRHTSQIGFFVGAAWIECTDPTLVAPRALSSLAAVRIGRTSFVCAPLGTIVAAVRYVAAEAAPRIQSAALRIDHRRPAGERLGVGAAQARRSQKHPASTKQEQEEPEPPMARPAPGEAWLAETCPYADCFESVRVPAAHSEVGRKRCQGCKRLVGFSVEQGHFQVWRDS